MNRSLTRISTASTLVAFVALGATIGATATACGADAPKPADPPTQARVAPASSPNEIAVGAPSGTTPRAADSPRSKGATLVTTPCVLHAGGAEVNARNGVTTMSCWYGAECFTMPGETHPGDGFVDVRCENTSCECEWSGPRNAPVPSSIKEAFTIDASPHGSDVCKDQLIEHCLGGISRSSQDGGAS